MSDKKKILIAEDNDFVRMQIAKFLADEGFEVIEAREGAEALEKMNTHPDMVIVDVRMEPMGGFDFIKALRGREIKIPAILVTGDQNPDLLSEASKWGVVAVLMKPAQRDRLVKTVTRTLKSHTPSPD